MAYSHQQRPQRLSGQASVFELPDSSDQQHPAMTATFLPGRDDDYYMPEVISPAPQRLMPEVPDQIADSLQNLEIQADGARRPQPGYGGRGPNMNNGYNNNGYGNQPIDEPQFDRKYAGIQEPTFSPFPVLHNPPPTVPPTDEDRLLQLDFEREQVLASNDPEAQLLWAQEALTFIEVALSEEERTAEIEGHGRPVTPDMEHQIKEDAMNVINFLADQEHPRADFIRGTWLEFGKFGMPLDKREAFRCYARSAEKGFARAEYRMGMQFENSNEPAKAIRHYQQGAAMGDSASNYRLGMMTLLGQHGQKQDYARGVNYIRRAANDADENAPQGAYVFGMLVARELPGITVPDAFLPNEVNLARQMIERAAYLGFSRAQLKMGTAYELCQLGCDFDPALSLHYNVLASRRGEAEADMAISKWFLCGHDGIFEKNEQLAFKYAQRAAAQQLPTAEFALGYFYEIGMYVKVDLQLAQDWYAKAAQHGNKDASGRIDGISRSKTLSRKDHENMAVSKIRARHGSQRQKTNPVAERHRFQATAPVIEEAVDMPDPRMPSVNSVYYEDAPPIPQGGFVRPPRGSSAAPGSGGPPPNNSFVRPDLLNQPGNYNRPGTAVPYPTMDRPGPSGHPPMRPSSAAGYGLPHGPGIRPLSIANIPPAGTYNNQRPNSGGRNAPFMVAPGQQGFNDGYGQQPYPEEPGFVQGGFGGGMGPGPRPGTAQPGRQGGPPAPVRPGTAQPGGPGGRPTSGHGNGIGFVAPPEAMAPLQPNKGGNKLQKLPPHAQGPNNRPGTANSMNNPNQPPQQRPGSARPNQQQQQAPPPQPTPQPASPPQQAPVRPPPAPTPAPGKGPKTFAEMGVPETKKEEECCIM